MKVEPIKVDKHVLWADGTISVDPTLLSEYIFQLGSIEHLAVTEITPEVQEYNQFAEHPITVKNSCEIVLPLEWTIPDKYKYLNLEEHLLGLASRIEHDSLYDKRIVRLSEEISLFIEHKLDNILRVLIYVIDVMQEKNVVWGVGRGSSCSSYLLFLLGLHEVDPVKYDIEITDFIR